MRVLCLLALISACSAEFDFDTEPLDAAPTDASAPEGGTQDVAAPDTTGPGQVACGESSCVLPFRACCVVESQSSCIEVSEIVCGGLLAKCDSSNDCTAGHVCCARRIDGGISSIQCRDTASCTSPDDVVLCDPTDPAECASCAAAPPPFPAGYHRCY